MDPDIIKIQLIHHKGRHCKRKTLVPTLGHNKRKGWAARKHMKDCNGQECLCLTPTFTNVFWGYNLVTVKSVIV